MTTLTAHGVVKKDGTITIHRLERFVGKVFTITLVQQPDEHPLGPLSVEDLRNGVKET